MCIVMDYECVEYWEMVDMIVYEWVFCEKEVYYIKYVF